MDEKYQKLAHEYSKLRAQANVLKRALLEEQTKGGQLKETTRLKEVELRRAEQEVDSLTFRNRQLEHRVGTLQEELERQQGGKQKRNLLHLQKNTSNGGSSSGNNGNKNLNNVNNNNNASSIFEDFQKKILENAQLISLLADKSHELEMCQQNLRELEEKVNSQLFKQSFVEDGLRHEIQQMCARNAELEVKLMETGRTNSDEDKCSVTTDNSSIIMADTAPVSIATEDRVLSLEKELNVLRAKYELLQLQEQTGCGGGGVGDVTGDGDEEQKGEGRAEEILFEHFSRKIDDILLEKQLAESKLASYLVECDSLKDQLEVLTDELRDQERKLKTVDDDLQTTRLKCGEQIAVLTEQVLSLSDQLVAASNCR